MIITVCFQVISHSHNTKWVDDGKTECGCIFYVEGYKEYFLKEVTIDEDYLFNKSTDVSYIATLLVTLELYIN